MRFFLFLSLSFAAWSQPYVSTVAGGNLRSLVPAAELAVRFGSLSSDASGNVYICGEGDVIRRMRPDGMVEIIAGTGETGYSGDGGPALPARLNGPAHCQFDSKGNLYFADVLNYRIRRIDPSGIVSTVAGTGEPVAPSDPESTPRLSLVYGFTIDAASNLYLSEQITTSSGIPTGRLRRIAPDGKIQTLAAAPQIQNPTFLAADRKGNIYIADGPSIRKLEPNGTISNFAGTGKVSSQLGTGDGGPAISAQLSNISGLTVDDQGDVYVIENVQFRARIRRVDASGTITGIAGAATGPGSTTGAALDTVLTTAGSPMVGNNGELWFTSNVTFGQIMQVRDGGIRTVAGSNPRQAADGIAARDAWFVYPGAAAVSPAGELFVSDIGCTVRKIGRDGALSTVPGTGNCATFPISATDLAATNGTLYINNGGNGIWSLKEGVALRIPNLPSGPLALDSKGQLYVLNTSEVWRLPTSGTPELYAGNTPSARVPNVVLRLPRALAIDSADNLYIRNTPTDSGPTGTHIYVISPAGQVHKADAAVADYLSPTSLAVDHNSNVWEVAYSVIYGAGPTVKSQSLTNTRYAGDDDALTQAMFSGPRLFAAPDGSILALDQANGRVRRIAGAGMTSAPAAANSGFVNAASLLGGAVAPGELVSIFGTGLGPLWPTSFKVSDGKIADHLATVQVLFDGRPAAITAISANQINVFVPFGVAGQASTQVIVKVDGVTSAAVTVPVAESGFGLFTANASGSGQAAALNQDYSYNNAKTPAAAGSIVSFYGTGVGAMAPVPADGSITAAPLPSLELPVTVTIGGVEAEVLYAGAAPSLPAGIVQINARVPDGVAAGDAPVVVSVGDVRTAPGVTVAVR
jgi:uncharacterized protein (TIGR03437 family)